MRLSKRMSELGLASRREADEWIARGWVKVDGKTAQTGQKVRPNACIEILAKAKREQSERVTILINKPVGYVSGQAEDGYEPARVLVRAENHWDGDRSARRFSFSQLKGLVPAGRLDIDSVGLLLPYRHPVSPPGRLCAGPVLPCICQPSCFALSEFDHVFHIFTPYNAVLEP